MCQKLKTPGFFNYVVSTFILFLHVFLFFFAWVEFLISAIERALSNSISPSTINEEIKLREF